MWESLNAFATDVGVQQSTSMGFLPSSNPVLGHHVLSTSLPDVLPSSVSSRSDCGTDQFQTTSAALEAAALAQRNASATPAFTSPIWEYLETRGVVPHGVRMSDSDLREVLSRGLSTVPERTTLPRRFTTSPTPSVNQLGDRRPRIRRKDSLYAAQHGLVVGNPVMFTSPQATHFKGSPIPREDAPVAVGGSSSVYQGVTGPPMEQRHGPGERSSNLEGVRRVGSHDLSGFAKLRGSFKMPRFSGVSLEWKPFVKALDRYASIQGLDQVMAAGYPTSKMFDFETNKLFYYVFQESVSILQRPPSSSILHVGGMVMAHI